MNRIENTRVKSLRPLISPGLLLDEAPLSATAAKTVSEAREQIVSILNRLDDRLLLIIGPCSIHDPIAAIEYANKLKDMAEKYKNELLVVMRVYFEKPRTTVGWKGLINDPKLDNSFDINLGLRTARELLLKLNEMGLPAGTEFLDTIIPQYISDLISWAAIGARTTESQIHRELTSGLSMPVGFKNGTMGSIDIAGDAIYAAKHSHQFLGVSKEGVAAIVSTTGNDDCHIILRGAKQKTNFDPESIKTTEQLLEARKLKANIMIDCSHGNSRKDYTKQSAVIESVCQQKLAGNKSIFGLMIESNLLPGNQPYTANQPLEYGMSITDACVGWDETESFLKSLSTAVKKMRSAN